MKKYFPYIIIIVTHFVLQSHGGGKNLLPWEKEHASFPMMNQEVRLSLEEHDRQKALNKKQLLNTATEEENKSQWSKWKNTATKIQNRLRIIDFAMQGIPTGYDIMLRTKNIKKNQERIIEEIKTAPYTIKEALPGEINFIDDLQMTTRFIVGLVVSYGAINQMEKTERKILLEHALNEVRALENKSFDILMRIRFLKERERIQRQKINYLIERDRKIVGDILSKVKRF